MRLSPPRLFASALLLALAACGPPGNVVPGRGALAVSLEVTGGQPDGSAIQAGDVRIDEFTLQVAELLFEADGPSGEVSISDATGAEADVVRDESIPPLELGLEEGRYTEASLSLELEDRAGVPALMLAGERDGVLFRLELETAEVFETEAGAMTISDEEQQLAVYTFGVEAWFAGVDLESGIPDAFGVVVLSDEENSDLFDEVADQVLLSTSGRLPPDEL